MIRSPQRSYTPQALELWFERLGDDWELGFREGELDWGRRFYRNAETRSTEVLEDSAVVSFRRGKTDVYVVIEWKQTGLHTRQSNPELGIGRGLAVAGMYELEELLADEIPPVKLEVKQDSLPEKRLDTFIEKIPPQEKRVRPQKPALEIRLDASRKGVRLEAGWHKNDGGPWKRIREVGHVDPDDREQLIRFLSDMHRLGFSGDGSSGVYFLEDPLVVSRFLKRDLPRWNRFFKIRKTPALEAWKSGVESLESEISIKNYNGESKFTWNFRSSDGLLSEEINRQLIAHPGQVHFVPGEGIFQVQPGHAESIQTWKTTIGSKTEGILPRYMVFGFLGQDDLLFRLSSEIKHWQKSLRADPKNRSSLPDYLRPYQKDGIDWLRHMIDLGLHPLLADEMGLGKTLQILHFLDQQKALGKERILVVCPASVIPVWQKEISRYFPMIKPQILDRESEIQGDKESGFWIGSYSQIRRYKHKFDDCTFAYAILDEAQFIKNPAAKVSQACFSLKAKHRLAMTGTPVENRLLDLWTLFRFLMPGLLGTRSRFEEALRQDRAAFEAKLSERVFPFILRRTKDRVGSDLPEKTEISWSCPLTTLQRREYEKLTKQGLTDIPDARTDASPPQTMHLLALLTRLREVCCDPQMLPGVVCSLEQSGKLEALQTRLEEAISGGSKIVVFSQFTRLIRRIRTLVETRFESIPCFELTGSTRDRNKPVKAFTETEGPAIFLVSLRAGGVGLNLQVADYVFLMDPWWNPAVEAQAIDRVHRIGQTRPVIVYRMIAPGTIEEKIEHLKAEKAALFNSVFDGFNEPVSLLDQFASLRSFISLDSE